MDRSIDPFPALEPIHGSVLGFPDRQGVGHFLRWSCRVMLEHLPNPDERHLAVHKILAATSSRRISLCWAIAEILFN